jgi:deazaflavin-dependent oxidoreductase (nitroreductase family)
MEPVANPADPAVVHALGRDMTIDITTIGRRSGEPRRIEIWFLNVDGTIYITGTPGRRDWFANLKATPGFEFHLKESITATLQATATEVVDPDERAKVFADPSASWYLNQGDTLADLIETAPMVRVSFDDR